MIRRRDVLSSIALGGLLASPGCLDADGSVDSSTPTPTHTPTNAPTDTQPPTPTRTEVSRDDGFVSPTASPDPIPALSCPDEAFERNYTWADYVIWGTMSDDEGPIFTLSTSHRSIALGETITITFQNVSQETQTTGNLHKSNLSVLAESGWTNVRGWTDGEPKPIPDDLWEFEPGETYVWEFPLTDEGVIEMSLHDSRNSLAVCPSLQPGRYRFAIGAVGESDEGLGLAVSFDVTDSA